MVLAAGLDPTGFLSFPGQLAIDLLGFNYSRIDRMRGPNLHDVMAYRFTGKILSILRISNCKLFIFFDFLAHMIPYIQNKVFKQSLLFILN